MISTMQRVALITGGSRGLGAAIAMKLAKDGMDIAVTFLEDQKSADEVVRAVEKTGRRALAVQADVRDEAALRDVLTSGAVDAIFAGAAITAVASRERESPGAIFDVNLSAVVNLIALAAKHRVRRLVALSSSAAMGEGMFGERPPTEADAPQPVTLYGITKAALESVARRWAVLSPAAPQVAVGRVSAVFGPWERATGAPLPHGGNRDWVYAPFVAGAAEWMLTADRLEHSMYNIGAGITWHPRVCSDALITSGLPVVERPRATELHFNDDLSRTRTHLDIRRLSQEYAAPPAPREAAASYARWVAAHADWFRT